MCSRYLLPARVRFPRLHVSAPSHLLLSIVVVSLLNEGSGCADKAANPAGLGESEVAMGAGKPAEEEHLCAPIRIAMDVGPVVGYPKNNRACGDVGRGVELDL